MCLINSSISFGVLMVGTFYACCNVNVTLAMCESHVHMSQKSRQWKNNNVNTQKKEATMNTNTNLLIRAFSSDKNSENIEKKKLIHCLEIRRVSDIYIFSFYVLLLFKEFHLIRIDFFFVIAR